MRARSGSGTGRGLLLGVGLTASASVLIASGRTSTQVYHVTSTSDGRVVHLWSTNGADLRYLASAEVPRNRVEPRGQRTGQQPAEAKDRPQAPPDEEPGVSEGKPGGGRPDSGEGHR